MTDDYRPYLIGISGKAQHGKDTIGQWLVGHGYTRFSFATPLKALYSEIDPIIGFTNAPVRLHNFLGQFGDWENAKQVPEVRRGLIELGRGARKHLDPGVWVRPTMQAVDRHIKDGGRAVITDVRFGNEADAVLRRGGMMIRVNRPGIDTVSTDPSETELDGFEDFHYVIENNGTREDLERKLERVATLWLSKDGPAQLA